MVWKVLLALFQAIPFIPGIIKSLKKTPGETLAEDKEKLRSDIDKMKETGRPQ